MRVQFISLYKVTAKNNNNLSNNIDDVHWWDKLSKKFEYFDIDVNLWTFVSLFKLNLW